MTLSQDALLMIYTQLILIQKLFLFKRTDMQRQELFESCVVDPTKNRTPMIYKQIMGQKADYIFNVLMVGNCNVGKTHLIYRYTRQLSYQIQKKNGICRTVGVNVEWSGRFLDLQGKKIKLLFSDTAGQHIFRKVIHLFYKKVDAIILAYDISQRQSFNQINQWFREVQQNTSKGIPMMLFGNKCDLKEEYRQVTFEEGAALAQSLNMPFFQTSAFKGTMIQQAILMIVTRLKQQKDKQDKSKASKGIILDDQKGEIIKGGKRRSRCC